MQAFRSSIATVGWHALRRAKTRHDVVFYTPSIGWMFAGRPNPPPGGAETQVLGLAKALARGGLRPAIVVYGAKGDCPEMVDGVSLITRRQYRPGMKVLGRIRELLRIWGALYQARAPAVVFRCAGLELGLIGVYTRLTRRRLIFSTANVVDFDFTVVTTLHRDRLLYRLGIWLADDVVVQTEEQIKLCERSFRRRPVLIKSIASGSGSRTGPPEPDAPTGPAEAFLWVGRLVSYKRPEAYLALATALPEAKFWMVGVTYPHDGDERRFGEAVLEAARAIPNLEILPPRSQPEIERLMSRAVASVNTARFEGMPNVLLEAWVRGVPALVLSHDPGGVVRTFGLGGFAGGSMERLVDLGRELWSTRSDRSELSERCRAYVAAHHAPARVADQWAELLGFSREQPRHPMVAARRQPGSQPPERPFEGQRSGQVSSRVHLR